MPVTIACQTLFHVLGTQEWPQEQTHKKQSPLTPLSTRPLGTGGRRGGVGSSPQESRRQEQTARSSQAERLCPTRPVSTVCGEMGPARRRGSRAPLRLPQERHPATG